MHKDVDLLELMYSQIDLTKIDEFHLSSLKMGALHTLQFLDHQIEQNQLQQTITTGFCSGKYPEDTSNVYNACFLSRLKSLGNPCCN